MKLFSFSSSLSFLFLAATLLPSVTVQAQKQDKSAETAKKRLYLKKITRLGPQKSGVLSIQDAANRLPKKIFSKGGKPIVFSGDAFADASVNVFTVHNGGKLYLVDAGFGSPRGELNSLLEKLEVKREKVCGVLLTHVHPDHIGGLLTPEGEKAFPNAKIFLSKKEFVWACSEKSPMFRAFEKVRKAYGEKIVPFAAGEKVEGLFLSRLAPGHTPGHTVYEYGNILFIGDLLHAAELQFADPETCASFDMDKPLAVRTRKEILSYGAKKGLLLAGAHIRFPGTGRVRPAENGFSFEPAKE
ncbi:MAG: MBL fold metallo-hydrolase [Lentisphaeria bacterium]|nr:MBL fold metallo-hydrolase [Lentisphaeria bacterium]